MIYWITNINDVVTRGESEEAPIGAETFTDIADQEARYDEIFGEIELQRAELENVERVSYDSLSLRVFRVLDRSFNPLITDFTILGFRKESPSYIKGRKVASLYKCTDKDETIVEKIFSDETDINGELTGLTVTFNWYGEDNSIALTKSETVKKYNKYEAQSEYRKRRERAIDYLVAGTKGTPVEPYLNIVFDHYYEDILKYKEKGTSEFKDAIENETDINILAILDIVVDPSSGATVRMSILGQIS